MRIERAIIWTGGLIAIPGAAFLEPISTISGIVIMLAGLTMSWMKLSWGARRIKQTQLEIRQVGEQIYQLRLGKENE